MNYIKILIIIFAIISIILIGTISYLHISNKDKIKINTIDENTIAMDYTEAVLTPEELEQQEQLENEIEKKEEQSKPHDDDFVYEGKEDYGYLENVSERATFFAVKEIYNTYISKINTKDSSYLKNILATDFINEYRVNDDNIFQVLKISELNNNQFQMNIVEMLTAKIDSTTEIFIVKGNCRSINHNSLFSVQLMIKMDNMNKWFVVYPNVYMKDKGIDQLKAGNKITNYPKDQIVDKINNHFQYKFKTDQQMAGEYFKHFKELINYYPDIAYNQLNNEYRTKRFENKENYNEYLKTNVNTLSTMNLTKYKINSNNNYTDYICIDQYGNTYTLRQQGGIMKYTIFLDDYTVPSKEFTETYNGYNDMTKAKYQAESFIKKINAKNYKNIYEHLNSTFKENNFKTLEEFKTYVKNNFYEENSFSIEDREVTNNYYIFECRIANAQNAKEIKKINIIVSIVENTDYTMSFSFSE